MVRQARTYFAGAVSGVTLIGIAIALFVVLVSAQVFHDWPVAALGFGHDDSAVAPAKSLGGERAPQTASTAPTSATARATQPARIAPTTAPAPASHADHHRHHGQGQAATAEDVTRAAPVVEEAPAPVVTGDESSSAAPATESSPSSSTSSNSTSSTPSNSSSGGQNSGGGNSSSASGSSGSSSGGSSGGSSSSGGGSTSGTSPVTETVETVTKTPANFAAGGNETVNNIDETVTGGALKEAGVTEVTEGVVNGLVGPESVVGKTVNGVGETVNGLLGGGSH
jgi:hypothetical protein